MNNTTSSKHHAQSSAGESDSSGHLKLAGTVLLVLLAGAFVYSSVVGKKSKPDLKTFSSVGDLAAEETAKLLGKSGKLVLVYDVYDPKSGAKV